jgi:FKBP-type peptidyl-prolyl cis-trans isomerase 2
MEFAVDQLVEFSMPNGQTVAGRILEIGDEAVKVDFNHPLADLSIEFEVEVEEILPPGEATSSEGDAQTDCFAPSPQPSPASGRGSEGDAQTD